MNTIAEMPFDPQRILSFELNPDAPVRTSETAVLSEAIAAGDILPNEPVMVIDIEGTTLAFETIHMALHNVIQGRTGETEWMVSFCAICNSGTMFSPMIDEQLYRFRPVGYYNAMTLLGDRQTDSYWDHIKGVAVHGEKKGTQLATLGTLTHMFAAQTAALYPDAKLVVAKLLPEQEQYIPHVREMRLAAQPKWAIPVFEGSLAQEDRRLPRLDLGLGVWTDRTQRYYTLTTVHAVNNILFDTLDGRNLLLYIDPESLTPGALFTEATGANWRGDVLHLNNDQQLRNGGLFDKNGQRLPMARPLQLFQRWYAFAATFPGCEIYRRDD
jgi:hypothetical protein